MTTLGGGLKTSPSTGAGASIAQEIKKGGASRSRSSSSSSSRNRINKDFVPFASGEGYRDIYCLASNLPFIIFAIHDISSTAKTTNSPPAYGEKLKMGTGSGQQKICKRFSFYIFVFCNYSYLIFLHRWNAPEDWKSAELRDERCCGIGNIGERRGRCGKFGANTSLFNW